VYCLLLLDAGFIVVEISSVYCSLQRVDAVYKQNTLHLKELPVPTLISFCFFLNSHIFLRSLQVGSDHLKKKV